MQQFPTTGGEAVVLGVDPAGAPPALLGLGVALARAAGRRLVLVSAVEPEIASDGGVGGVRLPAERASRQAARTLARAQHRATTAADEVAVASYLKVDSPVAALLTSVRAHDLLVVGGAAKAPAGRGELGSVARQLAVAAACDLVVVADGPDAEDGPDAARGLLEFLRHGRCGTDARVVLDAYAALPLHCLGCGAWSPLPSRLASPRCQPLLSMT